MVDTTPSETVPPAEAVQTPRTLTRKLSVELPRTPDVSEERLGGGDGPTEAAAGPEAEEDAAVRARAAASFPRLSARLFDQGVSTSELLDCLLFGDLRLMQDNSLPPVSVIVPSTNTRGALSITAFSHLNTAVLGGARLIVQCACEYTGSARHRCAALRLCRSQSLTV